MHKDDSSWSTPLAATSHILSKTSTLAGSPSAVATAGRTQDRRRLSPSVSGLAVCGEAQGRGALRYVRKADHQSASAPCSRAARPERKTPLSPGTALGSAEGFPRNVEHLLQEPAGLFDRSHPGSQIHAFEGIDAYCRSHLSLSHDVAAPRFGEPSRWSGPQVGIAVVNVTSVRPERGASRPL